MTTQQYGLKHFRYRLDQRRKEREKCIEEINNLSSISIIQNIETDFEKAYYLLPVETELESNLRQNFDYTNPNLTNFILKVENFVINYLNDPLIDLPMQSDDLLFQINNKFPDANVRNLFLKKILHKFAFTYKLIQ
jgi:hypothetical protein